MTQKNTVSILIALLLAASGLSALPAAEITPSWELSSMDWEADGASIKLDGGGERTFAWQSGQPAGREIETEVTVTPARRTAQGWAISAIAIRQDDRNYWHLGLVEAPESNGKRHFVELAEMLDGNWLAQGAADTRLSNTAGDGSSFNWQYGHQYRLKLIMNPESIEGTVSDLDGTLRTRIAYRFDKPAVTQGAPVIAGSALSVTFENFKATVRQQVPPPPATVFPKYEPTAANTSVVTFKPTGFFHVEQKDEKWWFSDPLGRQFYLIGTDHINFNGHWCEKLGYSPYGHLAKEKYVNEKAWADTTLQRLKTWGFNALPAGCSASLRHNGLPHIEFLSLGSSFSSREALCPKTTWTGFPDVFSPKWARHCDGIAKRTCAPNREDPWLLGYFLDNELEWYGKNGRPDGLLAETWKLDRDRPGKKALVEFLQKEFASIADFNAAFGTTFADFASITADTSPRSPYTEAGAACAAKWVRNIAEAYFKTCTDAIHKHDPNHLILGCRFAGRAPDVWDIAGKYCDVVSFNIYPRIDVERGVPESVLKEVAEWSKAAARPMMVTEWSFPALDAGLPSRHGAGMRVDTQDQRAKCFGHFQDFLFRQPYIIGSCYFMYIDEPALGISSTFPEDSNYGLISEKDEPYPAITSAASGLNPKAMAHHLEGGFKPYQVAARPLPAWMTKAPDMSTNPPAEVSLSSGRMSVEAPMGNKAWRMRLDGKPVADLFPLIHQNDGLDFWVQPTKVRIIGIATNESFTIVDMEFIRTEGDVKPDMKPESAKPEPRPFRAVMRYRIPRVSGWIASQCIQVENTGRRTWQLKGIYHYMIPLPASEGAKIEPLSGVENYYRSANGWVDHAAGRGAGCWYIEDGALRCSYWKSDSGSFHADLREEPDVELKPGGIFKASPDTAFFFPLPETTLQAHMDACAHIQKEIAE